MSDEIFFDGVRYVSAGEAAEAAGFTRDYVARLCKEEKLHAKRVGKQWYVNPTDVKDFAIRQEYARAKRSEELSQARRNHYAGAQTAFAEAQPVEPTPVLEKNTTVAGVLQNVATHIPHISHVRAAHALTSAPLHAASLKAHASAQVLPPAFELLHKFIAVTIAVLFTAGTFVLVDAQYARVAEHSTSNGAALARAVHHTLVAAAANPSETFTTVLQGLAKAFNESVDSFVYRVMFPRSFATNSHAKVVVRVSSRSPDTYAPNISANLAERELVTERIVMSAGGVTQESLNEQLAILEEEFVSRTLFDTQVDATMRSIENISDDDDSSSSGGSSITTPIAISDGGTGTTTAPSYGQVLLGNASGGYDLVATSSLGISGGGSSASTTLLADNNTWTGSNIFSSGLQSLASTTIGSGTQASGLTISGGATTTGYLVVQGTGTSTFAGGLTAAGANVGSYLFGANLTNCTGMNKLTWSNGVFSCDIDSTGGGSWSTTTSQVAGQLVNYSNNSADIIAIGSNATTSAEYWFDPNSGTAYLSGNIGIGLTAPTAKLDVLGIASSTNLFVNTTATTSNLAITNITNSLLSTNALGQVVATTSIGTNLLTGSLGTINNTAFSAGSAITITAASSTLLANNNTWTGSNIFSSGLLSLASTTIGSGTQAGGLTIAGGATTTGYLVVQGTATSTFAGGIQSTYLNITGASASSTFANGINLAAGCFAVNGTCISGSGGSSASSTLLADNNTFSGSNIFSTTLRMTSGLLATASSTIGDGTQTGGITIAGGATTTGNAYFAGNVGIGTTTPAYPLSITSAFPTGRSSAISINDSNGLGTNDALLIDFRSGASIGRFGAEFISGSKSAFVFRDLYNDGATSKEVARIQGDGLFGLGTTTPFAKLSLHALDGETNASLFAIASSTASATTTLFSISNTGVLTSTASATSTFSSGLQAAYLNITGTSATSTFARGIDLGGGCFSIAGVCLSSGGSGDITAVGNISSGDAFTSGTPGGELYFADNGFLGLGSGAGRIEFDDLTIDEVNILGANVGIGTSSPYAKLAVWGSGTGTGTLFELVNNASTTIASFLDNGTGYFLGNIGIGTTSPYRKLSLTDAVSTAQVSIAYDGTRYTELLTNSVGDLVLNPQGDDAFLNDDNLWVCTGGSCPSNNPTGTGNLVVENKIGIGTTTPDSKLVIETQDATTDFLRVASSTSAAQSLLVFDERGYLGIGTSTPTQQLSIANKLFVANGSPSSAGTATSTFLGDVLITGKLDVSTIDPVYTIDGVKYATYGHSTIGVKEEAVAIVGVTKKSWLFGKYEYTIDFDELEEGSDLWLFYQVSDFGAGWNNLAVTATAGFDGTVSYEKNDKENTLTLISSAPGEVSLRLIADRFDAEEWPNLRPDQGDGFKGFEISSKK